MVQGRLPFSITEWHVHNPMSLDSCMQVVCIHISLCPGLTTWSRLAQSVADEGLHQGPEGAGLALRLAQRSCLEAGTQKRGEAGQERGVGQGVLQGLAQRVVQRGSWPGPCKTAFTSDCSVRWACRGPGQWRELRGVQMLKGL